MCKYIDFFRILRSYDLCSPKIHLQQPLTQLSLSLSEECVLQSNAKGSSLFHLIDELRRRKKCANFVHIRLKATKWVNIYASKGYIRAVESKKNIISECIRISNAKEYTTKYSWYLNKNGFLRARKTERHPTKIAFHFTCWFFTLFARVSGSPPSSPFSLFYPLSRRSRWKI